MDSNWQELLGAAGARFDEQAQVSDFGDPTGELNAARSATIAAPLVHLGVIDCSGEDARTFLHNQLTTDVNHLDATSLQHTAWCTAKGRMLASFVLYRSATGYRALLSAELVAAMVKRLQIYVLRSKVKNTDVSAEHLAIGICGPEADAVAAHAGLPAPQRALESAAFADGHVLRLDNERLIVVVARAAAGALWTALAARARPVGTPVWQWLDVRAGLPRIGAATQEAFVPQMADFDQIGGVSFNKGCYPGQEIVARTKYLGKVKRHLYRVHADVALAAGDALFAPQSAEPEHACGLIANAAASPDGGYDALAVIQEEYAAAGGLTLGSADGARLTAIAAVHPAG